MRSALSKDDPHYSYEFVTSSTPPAPEAVPGCVLAETRKLSDGGFLTIYVVPKHRYADRDAAIQGTFKIEIDRPEIAVEFQKAFDGFSKFGRALDLPEGSLSATLDAPGGLGGVFRGGGGRIGPSLVQDVDKRRRIVIVHPKDGVCADVPIRTDTLTRGHAGGAELIVRDSSGILEMAIRLSPPDSSGFLEMSFELKVGEFANRPALEVLEVARLAEKLRPPYRLQIRAEYGTSEVVGYTFENERSLLPGAVMRFIEDLATVQDRASNVVRIPEDVDPSFVNELRPLARMLRGEVLTGTWDEVTLNLIPGVDRAKVTNGLRGRGPFAMEETRWVELDGERVELGQFTTLLASIRVSERQESDGRTVRLEPGPDNGFTRRAGPLVAADD